MGLVHWLFRRVRERALRQDFHDNQEYGRNLGRLLYYLPVFLKRKRIALDNISKAFGGVLRDQRHRILKGLFEHLGMSVLEVMSLERMRSEDLKPIFIAEGFDNLKGGGVIVSAHFGNWELALAHVSSSLDIPVNVIVRPPSDPFFAEYIDRIRRAFGARVIPKSVALREGVRCLKRGELLVVLADQDEGREGIFVPFMGRPASTPKGAFTLSLRYGVPLIPMFSWRDDLGYHRIKVFPLIYPQGDEHELAKTVNLLIEDMVFKYPSQWLWIHRRWKTRPSEGE